MLWLAYCSSAMRRAYCRLMCPRTDPSNMPAESPWALALDLLSAKVLVWIARRGRNCELTPEAHLYFFDRYQRLAAVYRARGRMARAKAFQAKADEHYRPGQDSGPPFAAAMAMP